MGEERTKGEDESLPHWEPVGDKLSFQCPIFDLHTVRFRHPRRESEGDFVVIKSPHWVNVLALTANREAILVEQFRFGTRETSLEVPGGIVDGDEDPVGAGLRELQEETGYVAQSARLIGSVRANPAIMDNNCYFVLAEGCRFEAQIEWDEHEELKCIAMPLDQLFGLAHSGGIKHAFTLNALFAYYPEWSKWQKRRRPLEA